MLFWTKKQAKDFIVNYQMINTNNQYQIDDVFSRLKTIQMDPLNVVGINPELVLQARVHHYKKGDLNKELYTKRTLIDGWEKQMSIYETKYFNCFKIIRNLRSEGALYSAEKYLKLDAKPYIDEVYEIVKNQGPILSSKIKLGETKKHRWGHTKPSTVAIDYLWHKGLLGIESRHNTQKKYDLIEKLHPELNQEDYFSNTDDFILWYLERRIRTVGLAWSKSVVHFDGYYIKNKQTREINLRKLLEMDKILEVTVEDIGGVFCILKDSLDIKNTLQDRISFIAPLDNLIWDRKLLKELFNFDYTWEVYTPLKKRKYGYYVLPILRKSDFIGKIEFKNQRNNEPLQIKSYKLENNITESKLLNSKLRAALNRMARYLNTTLEK